MRAIFARCLFLGVGGLGWGVWGCAAPRYQGHLTRITEHRVAMMQTRIYTYTDTNIHIFRVCTARDHCLVIRAMVQPRPQIYISEYTLSMIPRVAAPLDNAGAPDLIPGSFTSKHVCGNFHGFGHDPPEIPQWCPNPGTTPHNPTYEFEHGSGLGGIF